MISFIVIGKNEGVGIVRCLSSVVSVANDVPVETEVIYVDSSSTDNSVDLAKSVNGVEVYVLTADNNAAIARNVGAVVSKGEILFFIDGDMELQPLAMTALFTDDYQLKHPFISGNFENYYYTPDGQFSHQGLYKKVQCNEDQYQYTTGGLFAITKTLWNSLGGMDPMFKRAQDLDLGYRLAKKGYFLLRKKEVIAKHHTIDYKDKSRIWKGLKDKTSFIARAVLYRKHLFNIYVLKRTLTSDPTLLYFVAALIGLAFDMSIPLLLYPVVVLLGVLYSHGWHGIIGSLVRLFHQIIRDVSNFWAFFFYYPPKNNNISYERVN